MWICEVLSVAVIAMWGYVGCWLGSFFFITSTAVASSLSVLRGCCLTCLAFGDGGPSVSCLHDTPSIAIVAYVQGDEAVRCQVLWGFLNVM
jgi:hypothetical protein